MTFSKKWSFKHMQTTSNYMSRILILSPLTSVCSAKCWRQIPRIQKTEWISTLESIIPWFWGLLITSSLLPLRTRLTPWEWLSLLYKKSQKSTECYDKIRKPVNTSIMIQLCKAFVLPHFQYCSAVWHFCSSRNSEKLESLNKRALRVVFNDRLNIQLSIR